ncbi:alpha/beta hydrolase family protein [Streptomyces sp. 1114.5]|uniref:alpha/beta hydrolase n=1 Tax=Streptomyces sp. 1114.5 TaxID=1938830 RepID=UPI000EACD1AC|nr:alpha/beta hydrolase [Streptomyces sp. 1114.5]RKT16161.1 alpha/beta hydrolase family protein [Streptomyces sp. 1114.5]
MADPDQKLAGNRLALASLKNAKPEDLHAAGDAYDALHKAYAQHTADWKSGTTDRVHASGWSGPAADAAIPSLDATTTQLHAADIELATVGQTLRDYADLFGLAQSKLRQALTDAAAKGLTVSDTGAVSWPAPTGPVDASWEAKQKTAAEDIATRIGAALTEAGTADQALAALLRGFAQHATGKSGLTLAVAEADQKAANGPNSPYLRDMPAAGAPPTEVNRWWNGLDPAGRQWFIDHHPEKVGNLDGIPAEVRDQVNRAYLEKRMKELDGKNRTKEEEEEFQKLKPIRDRLDQDSKAKDGRPHTYLIGIGAEGQGRAILSFGNPDTATDISSYVPGITTTPDSLGMAKPGTTPGTNEAENALNVWREANKKVKPGGSVASIIWLGYDPPDIDVTATTPERALKGAPDYARFVTGLRATNTSGQCPHITSIGHSYGSLLVGQATKMAAHQGNYTLPDDVVIIGSPGVGVKHAADLGMPAGHVWAGAAANDPVTQLPSPKTQLAPWPFGGLIGADPHDLWYGRDPASDSFGATRFTVDGWSKSGSWVDFGMHTKYLAPETGGPSLGNIAAIISGRPDDVHVTEGR